MTDWPANMPKPTWRSKDGSVLLYHGDNRDLLPAIEAAQIEGLALVTDPPYGIGLRNRDVDGHRSNRWDSIAGDESQDAGLAAIEWARGNMLTRIAFASPWKPWPGVWRNLIVWDKGGAVGGGGDIATCLKRSWELIHVFNRGPVWGGRCESVWRFPIVPSDTAEHIAAKPTPLMRRLLTTFTETGGAVVDPFMGIGSTGEACVAERRPFIGIEIERKYFDIAVRRIEEAFDSQALFRQDEQREPDTELFGESA